MGHVVDTNVAMVAQGLAEQADQVCIDACIDALSELTVKGGLLLDDKHEIVGEYVDCLSHAGQPGAGRAFAKWAWDSRFNEELVRRVPITPRDDGGWRRYNEFPDRDDLRRFDGADQKFVAVAVVSGEGALILNAVDSDWWNHIRALNAAGVDVRFLCPQHLPDTYAP